MTYPYGVHLGQVEVDPGTGGVEVLRYFVAYEVGRAINPAMVEGQLAGRRRAGARRRADGGVPLRRLRPAAVHVVHGLPPPVGGRGAAGRHALSARTRRRPATRSGQGRGRGRRRRRRRGVAAAVEDALGVSRAIAALPVTPETARAVAAEEPARAGFGIRPNGHLNAGIPLETRGGETSWLTTCRARSASPDNTRRPSAAPHRAACPWPTEITAGYWLLLMPFVFTLFPWIYNTDSPELFGIPFFYWYQMAWIPISVVLHASRLPSTTKRG